MAVELSKYLRLRLGDDLTADSRYNLLRIDDLGSVVLPSASGLLVLRSEGDIELEPESPDVGGSGTGGTIRLGTSAHQLDAVEIWADSFSFSGSLSIRDQAVGGTADLTVQYKSDLSGSVDPTDRALSIDVNGADRSLVLGGNFSLLGGSLGLTLPAAQSYTYPSGYGSPGQVWSGDGAGSWAWTSIGGTGDVRGYSTTWVNGDGTNKTVTHSLGSSNVEVSLRDNATGQMILGIDMATVVDSNNVQLISSEAPGVSWTVTVHAK